MLPVTIYVSAIENTGRVTARAMPDALLDEIKDASAPTPNITPKMNAGRIVEPDMPTRKNVAAIIIAVIREEGDIMRNMPPQARQSIRDIVKVKE